MDKVDINEYKVAILDDEPMWRDAIAGLLQRDTSLTVVGTAATQNRAVDIAATCIPDVFLVDMMLKHAWQNGTSATIAILDASPTTKVIILTSSESEDEVVNATCAGAVDYLSKNNCEDLLPVIMGHLRKDFSPRAVMAKTINSLRQEHVAHCLTEQEMQLLDHLSRNIPRSQLAKSMNKSESTIKTQISSILKKLNVANISDAIEKISHGGVFFPQQKK